jgi:arginyl-tRNA synthetase
VDGQQLYPRLRNNDSLEWTSKKQSVNTVIEFSSPNIAKPLHAGHMRSTFLGNFLSKIHTNYGHSVTKINYLGDWGTQYGILAVGFKKYGSFDKLKESPIKHLLDVYVKANNDPLIKSDALEYFSQMEANDSESIQMWEQFKELSVKELDSVYKSLGISFNVFECESQYYVQSKAVVADLLEKGIANRLPNNAVEVELDAKKLKYILQKQDGTSLYISRDIAALLDRKRRYNFSKAVYVVDSSQRSHFVRLYETVKLLDKSSCDNMTFEEFYVPFGRLTNMSTRKGKVEFLAELILEAKHVALEGLASMKIKKNVQDYDSVAQSIGNSHLIISDLSRPRMKDYEFSWSNIVSKDDSAFMCHYSHARLFKYGS